MDAKARSSQLLFLLMAGFFWYLSSVMVNITSKQQFHEHKNVLVLTLFQFAVAEIICFPIFILYEDEPKRLILSLLKGKKPYIFMIGGSFCIGQLCTNTSLSLVSVSLTHMIKILEPLIALCFGIFILNEQITMDSILCMCIMLIGVAIATVHDKTFHMEGMVFAAFSNVAFQIRNLYTKLDQKNHFKSITLFVLSNAISLQLLIVLIALVKVMNMFPVNLRLDYQLFSVGFWFAGQHIMSFYVLQNVLITTHALLNVLKRLVIVVVSLIFITTYLSWVQFIGVGIAFMGFYFYSTRLQKQTTSVEDYRATINKVNKLCITCISILIVCTFSFNTSILTGYSNEQIISSSEKNNTEMIRQQNISITMCWTFRRILDSSQKALLESMARRNPQNRIIVFCGMLNCYSSNTHFTNIEIRQLNAFTIASGTPLSSWIRHHSIIKIISGQAFEKHFQRAMTLALSWKIGSVIIDLGLSVRNVDEFISRLEQVREESCIMGIGGDPLNMCYIKKENAFVSHLMHKFVLSFEQGNRTANHLKDNNHMMSPFASNDISGYEKNIPNDITLHFSDVIGIPQDLSNSNKFGIVHYETVANIGDYIQSIASAHFLPQINNFLVRDKEVPSLSENTTVILNAFWYSYSWIYGPMRNIFPVPVSIHLHNRHKNIVQERLHMRKDLFLRNSPIGTRDLATMNIFEDIGIPAKMTGCLTLFIQNPFSDLPRLNNIYLVDVPTSIKKLIPNYARKFSQGISHMVSKVKKGRTARYIQAYKLLEKYSRARLVITTRIHCALPCVAMGTPVIFLNLKNLFTASKVKESPRVSGLTGLFHHVDFYTSSWKEAKSFLESFNYTMPPPNPNHELAHTLRKATWSILSKLKDINDTSNIFGLRP